MKSTTAHINENGKAKCGAKGAGVKLYKSVSDIHGHWIEGVCRKCFKNISTEVGVGGSIIVSSKQPYFILAQNVASIGDPTKLQWECAFGDYDKQVVKDEQQDYRDRGVKAKNMKVIKLDDAEYATVCQAIFKLNGVVSK